jgi:hypothetical protein
LTASDESEGEDSDYYEMLESTTSQEDLIQAQKEKEEIAKNAP